MKRISSILTAAALAWLVAVPVASAAGPITMVKDINSTEGSDPTELTAVGDILYFSAFDDDHGRELWRSDGTADGTYLVADIKPGGGNSDPELMMGIDGRLYFTAQDGAHGRELWKTDGTTRGTRMVKNISAGSTDFWKYAALGDQLFFNANAKLWVTDGSARGTRPIGPTARQLVPVNGAMWFQSGGQLWRSDGTQAGTAKVAWAPSAVNQIAATSSALFILCGGDLIFQDAATTLWKTDGTSGGTVLLTAGYQLNHASRLVTTGSRTFFIDEPAEGSELWRSNGTVAGTKALQTIPGSVTTPYRAGERVLFFGNSGGDNWDLWKSNGKVAGTKAIDSFTSPYAPEEIAAIADELCFVTEDQVSDIWTLWITDGSVGGAIAVTTQPVAARRPFFMTTAGPRVFFSLDDGVTGGELWSYTP